MGNPFTFAICVAAALIVATGAVGAEKKQPAQYIKPDPATALLEFDYNLFKVSKWASERGKEQTAAAPHFQDLRSSVDLYRQFFRRNLAITASKPTQVTEPIILLNIDANEKTLKKKSGVNRVIIDLEPAEIEIAQAITQAAKIETDPNYQSPVYFCLNDYNQCIRRESRWICMPLIVLCMAQNVIPLAASFHEAKTDKKNKKGKKN